MMRRHCLAAVLASILLPLTASEIAAGDGRPVLAHITRITKNQFAAIALVRDKRPVTVKGYTPLYDEDRVRVIRPGVTATIEPENDLLDPFPIDQDSGEYVVKPPDSSWIASIARQIRAAATRLARARREDVSTPTQMAPAGPRGPGDGSLLQYSRLLPNYSQTVFEGTSSLTAVWVGGPASLRLLQNQNTVASAPAGEPGFGTIDTTPLAKGSYVLLVGAMRGGIAFNIEVTSDQTGREGPVSVRTIAALTALEGPASGRLDALSRLHKLAERDGGAYAALFQIEASHAPIRPD